MVDKSNIIQDHVISALPAYGIANLIRNLPSLEESHKLLVIFFYFIFSK